jgi:23S rRNA (uracil1939-C5)-methyltransferase
MMEIEIERLGINGEGVGHLDGFTYFVDGALPEEKVVVEIYEKRKTYARAKVVKWLSTSPHRKKPVCPRFGSCGGCQLMHLDYPEQLKAKRERVQDALERIGKLKIHVLPCLPSPSSLSYRNKIQLPVQEGNRLGLYAHNSHELIEIDQCYIHSELGDVAFQKIQKILRENPCKTLKHLLIKTAVATQQILVILVTSDASDLMAWAEKIMQRVPEVRGVVQNINPASGNVILGDTWRTVLGQGFIQETLAGLSFKVSPASFFQINPAQAEKLYEKVAQFCALEGKKRVLDAYCGVGTLSLILAKNAKEVIGVESVEQAITDADENARANKISNARFVCSLAEEFIPTLEQIDVCVLNPPRKGCEKTVLEKLAQLKPKRIVYVSCDPATLARDLQLLCSSGYSLKYVQPFDMFPQTAHVESVALLTR